MIQKIKNFRQNLTFSLVGATIILFMLICVVVSVIGYFKFTDSLTAEYTDSAYRTAQTAATLVNADNIEYYLETRGDDDEYRLSLERMNILCDRQNVSLIYVISVDTSNYESFVSVFNTVNKNSGYTPWDIGFRRDTTNDEYKRVYKDIYENGVKTATVVRDNGLNGINPHITSLIPLEGSDGEVKAVLCVQRAMEELYAGRRSYIALIAVTTFIMLVTVSCLSAIHARSQFILPMKKITAEAERFARESVPAEHPLDKNISKIKEISVLASSINDMESDMQKYIENLTYVTAEKKRISTELSVASQIQRDDLPSMFPPYPERGEFDIYASMTPAKEVGGDFYDFFMLDDKRIAVVIADVSGKGVPAALFMMVAKILIKERALLGGTPAEILTFANGRICENNKAGMFVTVWMGVIDTESGVLTYVNAGHNPPVVKTNGKYEYLRSRTGFVLGGFETTVYRQKELQLQPGDRLFLYTDGVTEATNAENELYGEDRLAQYLMSHSRDTVYDLLDGVKSDIDAFVAGAEQFDDMTMLVFDYNGSDKRNENKIF